MNDDLAAVTGYLREIGAADIRMESGGKHPRLVFLWEGRERFFVRPSTPGDTMRGHKNAISELRHMLGLVKTEKRVGERRARRRSARAVTRSECPSITALPDWRVAMLARMNPADLRKLADLAWLSLWRESMARVGGRSLL